jgi:SAM-dependent methyltransferase
MESRIHRTLRSIYHRLPAPPSTNYVVPAYDHPDPFAGLPAGALIYNVGSKRVEEYDRWRLPPEARMVRVDIDPGVEPDILADAHDLNMIADNSADCVIAIDILEHCAQPTIAVSEFLRILKPGGRVFIGIPFMFPYHADPHDHWRVTVTGIDHLCREFDKVASGFVRGPASCMAHLNIHFFALLLSFNNKMLYGVLVDLFQWSLAWTKFLDRWLMRHPMAHVIHAGVWFLGTKPGNTKSL